MGDKKPTVGPKGGTGTPPKVKGLFDMEKRLSAIEKKVEVIYNVSLALDKWLTAHAWNKGLPEENSEQIVVVLYGKDRRRPPVFYGGQLKRPGDVVPYWTDDLTKAVTFNSVDEAKNEMDETEEWNEPPGYDTTTIRYDAVGRHLSNEEDE